MPRSSALVRRAFFVEPRALQRARRVLGAKTDAEVVRRSIDHVLESDAWWRFMRRSKGRLPRGTFRRS
jgi:hypothetical protein